METQISWTMCSCGCGKSVKAGKRFIRGHHNRGKRWKWPIENRLRFLSVEQRELLATGAPLCGCGCGKRTNWNRKTKRWYLFLMGHNSKGIPRPVDVRARISASLKGRRFSCEVRRKYSEAKLGQKNGMYGRGVDRMGAKNPMYGKAISEWHKRRITESCSGPKHPNWRGGISRLPYSQEWTGRLKEKIRKRDGYMCRLCCSTQSECGEKLTVHHIDYNKLNCTEDNLVCLCRRCHALTVYSDRHAWMLLFCILRMFSVSHDSMAGGLRSLQSDGN